MHQTTTIRVSCCRDRSSQRQSWCGSAVRLAADIMPAPPHLSRLPPQAEPPSSRPQPQPQGQPCSRAQRPRWPAVRAAYRSGGYARISMAFWSPRAPRPLHAQQLARRRGVSYVSIRARAGLSTRARPRVCQLPSGRPALARVRAGCPHSGRGMSNSIRMVEVLLSVNCLTFSVYCCRKCSCIVLMIETTSAHACAGD